MNKKTLHNFVELIPELIDNSLWVHQYKQPDKQTFVKWFESEYWNIITGIETN